MLEMFEGRALTCLHERSQIIILGPDPKPEAYYRAIARNIMLIHVYLQNIDVVEFRNAVDVENDSPIARGRQALIIYARTADKWMTEASLHPDNQLPMDPDLAECSQYFSKNCELIDMYEKGDSAPAPRPTWANICDAIILSFHIAHEPLNKATGGDIF